MRNAGLEEAHLESRLPGEIAITSDMQMTPPLRQKAKRTKEYLTKVNKEHWGTCVSFNSGFLGVYAQQWDCWVIR